MRPRGGEEGERAHACTRTLSRAPVSRLAALPRRCSYRGAAAAAAAALCGGRVPRCSHGARGGDARPQRSAMWRLQPCTRRRLPRRAFASRWGGPRM
eukprot:5673541-Prymnesium_polylepis.2